MKTRLLLALGGAVVFWAGCAAGIKRTGYHLPAGQVTTDRTHRPIAIQCEAKYDTNDVVVLGSIRSYDTGFSTHCDEATILDIFRNEGNMLGADLINITEEKEPNPLTSTCYRAKATFVRFKDQDKAKGFVSDTKYSQENVAKRVAAANKRNTEVLTGAIIGAAGGGAVGGIVAGTIVAAATAPAATNHVNAATPVRSPRH